MKTLYTTPTPTRKYDVVVLGGIIAEASDLLIEPAKAITSEKM